MIDLMREDSSPSRQLAGQELEGGWRVLEMVGRRPTDTGSCFSTGYIVENVDGRRGFLKALDYVAALFSHDTAGTMASMTATFVFERELCELCRSRSMRRVVHAIDSGEKMLIPGMGFTKVSYLIFDLADGDIRQHLRLQTEFDVAFVLRTLHHVAVGLNQLHSSNMAHQDLKPSNVLVYTKEGVAKIGDLGRAWSQEIPAPHDERQYAGDPNYSPPELLMGFTNPDSKMRRMGYDMYQLGNLIVFMFTRVHMLSILLGKVRQAVASGSGVGGPGELLPYFQVAFAEALEEFRSSLALPITDELCSMIAQLCEPDPSRRGHPQERRGTCHQYSLTKYISWLNLLAFKAEVKMLKGTA